MEKTQKKIAEVLYNEDLHFEHKQWRSELAFWEDELKSFKNRLAELVKRWTDKNVLAQLEHYQNEFILHGEVIDTLQHEINVHETDMAEHSKKNEDVIDRNFAKQHLEFRHKMEKQREIYADLKKDFFRFLSKYM
ncbi:hypothetical protein [Maribacter sp. ACAM166]|uniref:hypothetical protein n=1 Tax=Maribacter sp. ACAM166 TaxID=2508996 RepID=UPI0010FD5B4D|nr:hypothetical protein [Maribacter sp. ACAM166]TLP81748.1 hypothetical protein ES765_03435 [Maribacter sp. ACAM166]